MNRRAYIISLNITKLISQLRGQLSLLASEAKIHGLIGDVDEILNIIRELDNLERRIDAVATRVIISKGGGG